jgi:hypothetical protein
MTETNEKFLIYLDREVKEHKTFKEAGTFESYYAAQHWAEEKGYVYGSMCGDKPIALRKGESFDDYDLPEKWKNMSSAEKKSVDGVIISNDFREGTVHVLLF